MQITGILLLCVAIITTLFFPSLSNAAPGTNKTINFQGRLLTNEGQPVADGRYNIQFKIYQDGNGNVAGNPGGTLKWTETYLNNGSTSGVEVKNGFLSVELGANNPFGTSVDWNKDVLWLSMNVAGSSAACSTFGTGACIADGEMLPMKRLTATPYAINAGAVGGKTADNFVQLAQGVQTDATLNTSSVFINKTGTGNLVQLQSQGNDIFTITNAGNLAFGNNTDKLISVATSKADTAGRQLSVVAGGGGTGAGSAGGNLVLQGGAAGGTNGDGGSVSIDAGAKTGDGITGDIAIGAINAGSITIGSTNIASNQTIRIGTNDTEGSNSDVIIGAGENAEGGSTTIQGKNSVTIKTDGTTRATFSDDDNSVYFGNGVTAAQPNDFTLQGTGSTTAGVDGGSLAIQGGGATTGDTNGGNLTLSGGTGNGGGANGLVILSTPTLATATSDPNCYASGATVAESCTLAPSSVNNTAAVIVGFSEAEQTATLPDPTLKTPGRLLYILAAKESKNFTLLMNDGQRQTVMRPDTASALLWNGNDWIITSTSSSASNDVYNSDSSETNVQIGSGSDDGSLSLLTVDRAASAPVANDDALLGSMYYDTTVGALQCYEADGWGACSSAPDTFVSLSPEYANAVVNTAGIGTMTTDFCSDGLDANDGSSGQPVVCATGETYNYYQWTSTEAAPQTRSIFVNYQLPDNFKNFVASSTSLLGRSDSINSSVSYQIYRNDSADGLVACGDSMTAANGEVSWQKAIAGNASDPANCGFKAGDSLVIRINLTASNGATAYASNLGFTYSSQ